MYITAANMDNKIMLSYSAKKNTAKAMPPYSTWKPATISDSPSAKSKGARLVSATEDTQCTTNKGNNGMKNQCVMPPDCAFTICVKFNEPAANNTPTKAK